MGLQALVQIFPYKIVLRGSLGDFCTDASADIGADFLAGHGPIYALLW